MDNFEKGLAKARQQRYVQRVIGCDAEARQETFNRHPKVNTDRLDEFHRLIRLASDYGEISDIEITEGVFIVFLEMENVGKLLNAMDSADARKLSNVTSEKDAVKVTVDGIWEECNCGR